MSESPHLGLGYLAPSQAQKHVTVNEAFRRLDALVQLGVLDRTLTAPPASPAEGDRHIVAAGATGLWAGRSGDVAAWLDGVWLFIEPKPGWLAYVAAEGALLIYLPGGWTSALGSLSSLEALTRLGVNAQPDAQNRLAVGSQAVLFSHDGAGVQVKLNKAHATDVASFLFQTGFSGRAEFGTVGSEAFSLKVSPDGSSWASALTVDPATGQVDLPATPGVAIEKFTASGVWTKPAWARRVRVHATSGGSGGGSGALRAAGAAASGGGGGGPGVSAEAEFAASDLSGTVAVTVGAGGAGGAAQTVADGNGATGATGGFSAFGAFLKAAPNAAGGVGGTGANVLGGTTQGFRCAPAHGDVAGGAGSTAAGGAGASGSGLHGAGGGGGGGLSTANLESAGGVSGAAAVGAGFSATVVGGAVPGGPGGSGTPSSLLDILPLAGASGSGGASGAAVNGGAGGDGAAPGGAGGGGGASRNGRTSGKGGNGARGEVWVISMR